ncbi:MULTISPECIES: pantoate--beta-alanine ligase [Thermodesulfobacterium]|jgi:pantoate--beta-alanine ligase|uniref:Pantothenate synthetase n=2 Tax=Thermodesulfobacterium commune TaxID=1741 RepID=A0A075WUX6_9BACT|nr:MULTISPECIES: pantoate--beta-alanine ligase [Thermodesulfobacterium]KUJ98274.1 MAG: Pantothenate synthetase [Thermodesulfobacterium sp. 37_54]KUK18743.1 MAG: Pantothenate synthetase [Thermodesulfobacterium commune]AIH04775.1 pantoate--beta-alanine ligase [Thermodesulfobacterium commune DSM 2178]KUK38113.1 MAG: Pantothenate synthetase [Thermodesulfobacterium commune]MBZ4682021.1 pantoate--beta-alanine ligase [Thermodesulfobacterium sp.]
MVEVIKTIPEMKAKVKELKKQGYKIGFVPTMGYLHEGHLSLVRKAKSLADKVVVSIFVNPLQFGPREDFREYPRDLERDLSLLEKENVDVVFVPSEEEMYPSDYQTYVEVVNLTDKLCGAFRPGHFKGVTTVVLKLFNIIQPDIAVFGEKDYQQLLVIKQMVKDLNLDIEIVGSPTVREPDGLAMSSRNIYLSPKERESAVSLNRALELAEKLVKEGEKNPEKIKKTLFEFLRMHPYLIVQYIEIVDPETLDPVEVIEKPVVCAIAAYVGKARLIDNRLIKP